MTDREPIDLTEICAHCGKRRGLHAGTDDQCPRYLGFKWIGWEIDSKFEPKPKKAVCPQCSGELIDEHCNHCEQRGI